MILLEKVSPECKWQELLEFVKKEHSIENSGHGFDHLERTLNLSNEIAKSYPQIDYDILTASCLLHDIAFPSKGHKNHHIEGEKMTGALLPQFNFPKEKIEIVCKCVLNHAGQIYSEQNKVEDLPMEGRIMIDADNLDALGSVGLIRAINFCVKNNIPYYLVGKGDSFNESIYGTIEKITGWDKNILTKEGRELAKSRIKIMLDFLKQLDAEI